MPYQSQGTLEVRRIDTRTIVESALLVALLVCSVSFTIPIGPVPFTLQTMVVMLVALLCSPKQACIVTGVYLLMGALGLPVFSNFTGGLGKLLGPTGGFLLSYLIGSASASALRGMLEKRGVARLACDIVAVLCIIVISDVLGWLWYMAVTDSSPLTAFLAADAPFIVVDCCKGVVAVAITGALRKALGHRAS